MLARGRDKGKGPDSDVDEGETFPVRLTASSQGHIPHSFVAREGNPHYFARKQTFCKLEISKLHSARTISRSRVLANKTG